MRIPAIRGVIDRRILANYRVQPDVLARILPRPFRPKLVGGFGVAGICLIRLKAIRPRFVPSFLGISSENAAHRIAVEWDDEGETREGVYIPRRDTSSRLNALAGGRLFPGVHHRGRFRIAEADGRYGVEMDSAGARVVVEGRVTSKWPVDSMFDSLETASRFFERGSLGYSPSRTGCAFDGLELCTRDWHVEPLAVEWIESSFFDDASFFPPGTVKFDCALLMRGIRHEWRGRESLACCQPGAFTPSPAESPEAARGRSIPARRASAC